MAIVRKHPVLSTLSAALIAVAFSSTACDRAASPQPQSKSRSVATAPSSASASATASARTLRELYLAHDYAALAELIVPDRRRETVDLLRAIAEVLAADRELRAAAESRYLVPVPQDWGFSPLEDAAGIFSRRVNIIAERQSGDSAIVIAQQGDNLPLIRVRFVRNGLKWLLIPDPAPADVADRVYGLAQAIREVVALVNAGADYETYGRAITGSVMPHVTRIVLPQLPVDFVAAAPDDSP